MFTYRLADYLSLYAWIRCSIIDVVENKYEDFMNWGQTLRLPKVGLMYSNVSARYSLNDTKHTLREILFTKVENGIM